MLRGLQVFKQAARSFSAMSVPTTQKAVVFDTYGGPLMYKDVPVPVIKPNEILINIKYSGVCHSDLTTYKGDWGDYNKTKLPLIGGHEGVGVVVAVGANARGWKVGDHAGLKLINGSCMDCDSCALGNDNHCDEVITAGSKTDGSFQQYAAADAFHAAHIPPGVDLAGVAPILCAGVTAYKALKTANVQAGEWVSISGAGGGVGSLAVQYAKAMGLLVIGIDGGESKAQKFHELGGDEFLDFTKVPNTAEAIRRITGRGVSAAINFADSQVAIQQSLGYVRTAGTVVLVGLPPTGDFSAPIFPTVVRSVNIRGSFVGNKKDTMEAIDFFARGKVRSPIKIAGLSELPRIYEEMEKRSIVGRYVVDTSR